jgi:hypothetical protein
MTHPVNKFYAVLHLYERQLNSPYNIQCSPLMPNFIEIRPVISDIRAKNVWKQTRYRCQRYDFNVCLMYGMKHATCWDHLWPVFGSHLVRNSAVTALSEPGLHFQYNLQASFYIPSDKPFMIILLFITRSSVDDWSCLNNAQISFNDAMLQLAAV